jgi:hypothetical protein
VKKEADWPGYYLGLPAAANGYKPITLPKLTFAGITTRVSENFSG